MTRVVIDGVRDSQVPLILERLKTVPGATFKISYRWAGQAIVKRLELIMRIIQQYCNKGKEHRLETYFRLCRKEGYAMNRKTFTRDIDRLVEMEKIQKKVIVGGKKGTTSIIRLNENSPLSGEVSSHEKEKGDQKRKQPVQTSSA